MTATTAHPFTPSDMKPVVLALLCGLQKEKAHSPFYNAYLVENNNTMSDKNKKQFGVWLDSHNATITGRQGVDKGDFVILGHVKNPGADKNSSENASNNQEIALTHKYFKEIAEKMPNIDEVHVTGTGQVQEQFIRFLAETPQYKNAASSESTSNKMNDEGLVIFITKHFN